MSRARARLHPAARAAMLLGACALFALALLAVVHTLAAPRIEAEAKRRELATLATVLPPALHDNDLLADAIAVHAPHWTGYDQAVTVRRARLHGQPAAIVLPVVASGYAGPIHLLVAIAADGRVLGARVLRHQETPGLGDWIEIARSDWIEGFRGRSLDDPPPAGWAVVKDGGVFDQFAGATVTPRAVVAAIARALQYQRAHRDQLYSAAAGSVLRHDEGP